VSNFFTAQIEANKLAQYSLLSEWRREGRVPDHTPVDLASTIRAKLDEVDKALIAELTESKVIRASASCRTEIARAAGKYASAHMKQFSPLKAIALDRALATACISPYGNENITSAAVYLALMRTAPGCCCFACLRFLKAFRC